MSPSRATSWVMHFRFELAQPSNHIQPKPGDGFANQEDLPPEGWGGWCIQEYVPPAHIVHVAKRLDESLISAASRFKRASILGLKIPEIDFESLSDINVEEEDVIALSRRIDEVVHPLQEGKTQWKKPWINDRISAAQLVLASTRLNEPIGQVIKRLQKFQAVGLKVVNLESEELEKIKITPEDIIALSRGLDGQEAWSKDFISPVQIAFVSRQLNEPITRTHKRFERFLNIGLKVPQVNLDALDNFRATEEDIIALSVGDISERVAWPKERLPVAQIVQAAWRLGDSLNDVLLTYSHG